MRHLFLVLTTLAIVAVPVHAASLFEKDNSPELRQCVQKCKQEKDASARESCEIQCAKAETERKKKTEAESGGK
jgi:hypothetical protein